MFVKGVVDLSKIIEVRNLKTYFCYSKRTIPAVDDVSFYLNKGETVCIVGESGCGKSVTALSIMKLVQSPPGKYISGQILFNNEDLLKKPESEMRKIRGEKISMIYQDPQICLNPVFTIGYQIIEVLKLHKNMNNEEALKEALNMLSLLGIADPNRCVKSYPHQLSGGMCQRIMIAMALCCNPELLIADEPTTALDVTIQAQILALMHKMKKEFDTTILFITHDMGVVAEMADRVIVFYAGKIVEEAPVVDIFENPIHPYTEGLLSCIPGIKKRHEKLNVIKGSVPSPTEYHTGCRFSTRCAFSRPICYEREPLLRKFGQSTVACHFNPKDRQPLEEVETNCD